MKTEMDDVKPVLLADVALLADLQQLPQIAEQLVRMNEVCALYVTTGTSNLRARIAGQNIADLHRILNSKVGSIQGLNVMSTNLITEVVKEKARDGDVIVDLDE